MSQINSIKEAYAKGYCYAEIARKTGVDVKTVKKYVLQEDFSPKAPIKSKRGSILDPFKPTIDQWLKDDKKRWYKQRHTARRVFDRLQDELGYKGSYPTVQRYVKAWREEHREQQTFQELVWHPGEAQADVGEADFVYRGRRRRLYYLTLSFPYSNYSLTQVIPDVTALSICASLQAIFSHLDRVPKVIVFDNATGVGRRVGSKETETELFARFRAHYLFELRFCNPNAGHEKGHVEGKIGYTRRNLFVPERSFVDVKNFNRKLLSECEAKGLQEHYRKGELIQTLFAEERQVMGPFPTTPFDVCEYVHVTADSYGRICLNGKHFYGSRPDLARQKLLVRIRTDEVTVYDKQNMELVTYPRAFGSQKTVTSIPETTLKHLARHPRSWFNSQLRENLDTDLRKTLDALDAYNRREVLKTFSRLTEDYDYNLALEAVREGLARDYLDFDTVAVIAARLRDGGLDMPPSKGPSLVEYDLMLKEVR